MSKTRILLVDDEPILLKAVEFKLKKEGMEVVTAMSGEEAMAALGSQEPFDIVISDVMMPGVSGIELLRKVKDQSPDVKVLLLTGLKTEETVVDAFDLGADDFMTKPFNPKELSVRVKRLLKS